MLSRWGQIEIDGSQLITCLNRWKMQLIYSKQKQTTLQLVSLCLIMPQVIRNKHLMHYQQKKPKNPNQRWMSIKGGLRMWIGYMNGSDKISQDFYFPDHHPKFPGWFKGMENIIHKWGLWSNEGLKAECNGFKCVSGHTNCCSH